MINVKQKKHYKKYNKNRKTGETQKSLKIFENEHKKGELSKKKTNIGSIELIKARDASFHKKERRKSPKKKKKKKTDTYKNKTHRTEPK